MKQFFRSCPQESRRFETQQFFHPDSYGRCLKPLRRIVSNRRGFIKWIHSVSGFNCVDAKKVKNTVAVSKIERFLCDLEKLFR